MLLPPVRGQIACPFLSPVCQSPFQFIDDHTHFSQTPLKYRLPRFRDKKSHRNISTSPLHHQERKGPLPRSALTLPAAARPSCVHATYAFPRPPSAPESLSFPSPPRHLHLLNLPLSSAILSFSFAISHPTTHLHCLCRSIIAHVSFASRTSTVCPLNHHGSATSIPRQSTSRPRRPSSVYIYQLIFVASHILRLAF